MRAVFLVLLLWAVACAHPVPGRKPARPRRSAQQEDTASKDYINKLGNLLGGGDGRHPPASAESGDGTLAGGNAVGKELGEHGGQDKGGRAGKAQHLNWVDLEDASAWDRNSLGFLEEDARDADDGDNGEHRGTGVNGLPSHAGGLLDEEDDSGDDTFDENGEEEGSEAPTYMAGADEAGEHGHDAGRGDVRPGRGHGDSSSSSSSESIGADHWRASRSGEDGDGEDSPSREGEGSKSREGMADQSDEEPGESAEDISQEMASTSSERSSSRSREGQEDPESAEDRSAPSTPDSESGEDEGDHSKSGEDDGDQSQSTEDTVEESKEDENDSDPDGDVLSTSAESQSTSPEDDSSQEDNAGEDSRFTESNNSESQEDDDDDDEESHSQEDATRESSSRGDNSSLQSLESGSRKRRPGAYRNKPAADYDDNDCQDGY
ncbi:PREDICTED: dentin matrix acidic phosphoprotein 1-like [Fulmarus glacialis]|nr:PREDICTED: dentin matrix acidic phosphoprotein 1-like [Fulmarus glacialis]